MSKRRQMLLKLANEAVKHIRKKMGEPKVQHANVPQKGPDNQNLRKGLIVKSRAAGRTSDGRNLLSCAESERLKIERTPNGRTEPPLNYVARLKSLQAESARTMVCGNCAGMAAWAMWWLTHEKHLGDWVTMFDLNPLSKINHQFLVLGLRGYDGEGEKQLWSNPDRWNADAVICDPWYKAAFPKTSCTNACIAARSV